MLCQECKKNESNVKFTTTINNETKTVYLCSECAKKLGYDKMVFNNDIFSPTFLFDDFVSSFFKPLTSQSAYSLKQKQICPFCGADMDYISNTSKFGCASCYDEFYERLLPSIKKIQGSTSHKGKIPRAAGEKVRTLSKIDKLNAELKEAIDLQEYEKAAKIRDMIKELKERNNENE